MSSRSWRAAADRLLLRDYCIDLDDVGLDDAEISALSESFADPAEFVRYLAQKHDLTSVAEVGLGGGLGSSYRPS